MTHSYLLEKSIRPARIKHFVAVHHRHQVLRLAQINDIMRISWQHVHSFDLVPRHFPLQHRSLWIRHTPLLNEAMPLHHEKLLKLRMVPMLSLGDTWLRDIDRNLLRETLQQVHDLPQRRPVSNRTITVSSFLFFCYSV